MADTNPHADRVRPQVDPRLIVVTRKGVVPSFTKEHRSDGFKRSVPVPKPTKPAPKKP